MLAPRNDKLSHTVHTHYAPGDAASVHPSPVTTISAVAATRSSIASWSNLDYVIASFLLLIFEYLYFHKHNKAHTYRDFCYSIVYIDTARRGPSRCSLCNTAHESRKEMLVYSTRTALPYSILLRPVGA